MASQIEIAKQLIEATRKAELLGLNRGTSGNLSVRFQDGFLITPSGMTTDEMEASDIVEMNFSGQSQAGKKPSSEWRFHCDILKNRADVNAVVHTHSMFATTLACLGKEIPPFHYMIAVTGGDSVRCAPYALFGSQELSDVVVQGLLNRKACLMQNHGMVSVGKNLKEALAIAIEVETLCEQYWRSLQIEKPRILSEHEMHEVLEKFRDYGKWVEDS